MYRWKRTGPVGERPAEPTRLHQRWNTDLTYLPAADVWYFLVTVQGA